MMSRASSAASTASAALSSSRSQPEMLLSSWASSLLRPAAAKSSRASLPARTAASGLPPAALETAMAWTALPSRPWSPSSLKSSMAAAMSALASSAPRFLSPALAMCRPAAASAARPSNFASPRFLNAVLASDASFRPGSAVSGFAAAISARARFILASPLLSPDDLKFARASCANWPASFVLPWAHLARATRRSASAMPALSPASREASRADCPDFSAASASPTSRETCAAAARSAGPWALPAMAHGVGPLWYRGGKGRLEPGWLP
mmetsp:Transcript_64006/g.187818  ORF Transcript_64006/g.187818 Transcript_64006/m.187818 type:complete len:267 (+) Transcript_64006:1827-2627(+)